MEYLTDFVVRHMRDNNMHYHIQRCEKADNAYIAPVRGENTEMLCGIQVYEGQRRLCMNVFSGVRASNQRMPAVYEFCCRVNNCLAVGSYWVDPDAGDVSFAVTASLLELEPTDMWMGSLIHTALKTYDTFFPALAAILYAGQSPLEALLANRGPNADEVSQTVARLLSHIPDEPSQHDAAADPPPDRTVIRPRHMHKLVARLTPEELEEALRKTSEESPQPKRRRRKSDGQTQ